MVVTPHKYKNAVKYFNYITEFPFSLFTLMFKSYNDHLSMILVNHNEIKINLICNNIKFLPEMNL